MSSNLSPMMVVLLGYAHPKICMNYTKFYARVTRVGKQ